MKVAVFDDFECPFCRLFHASVRAVQDSFPNDVQLVVVHNPLAQHRFALPSARAAECARMQNGFMKLVDVIYAKQDSLGLKAWDSYAEEAGLDDPRALIQCVTTQTSFPGIDQGIELSQRLGINRTPTVVINGWRVSIPPNTERLTTIVRNVLRGKDTKAALVSVN